VQNAYSAGGIPLKVDAVANVKIASEEPLLGNAVERFLDKGMAEVHQIAKETLEGNLRGVLATLTPEEVNEDRLKFAQSLIEEADQDLGQLGLKLDTLKIQNVSDDAGYLDSIGRRKTADVLSAARTAEAMRQAEAEEAEAEGKRRAEVARAKAAQAIEVENTNLRVKKAELEKVAVVKEQEALVAGEKAKVQFEQEAEAERIILQQKRLTADVIEPARAKREAMELEAKGAAASIIENGQAKVRVLQEMIATYASAAGNGEKVFVLNMLPEIVAQLSKTVDKVTVDKVSVIDSGGSGNGYGSGLSRFVTQFPAAVVSLSEQIENATGVSLLSSLGKPAETTAEPSERKKPVRATKGQPVPPEAASQPDVPSAPAD
jgi:flotillin